MFIITKCQKALILLHVSDEARVYAYQPHPTTHGYISSGKYPNPNPLKEIGCLSFVYRMQINRRESR